MSPGLTLPQHHWTVALHVIFQHHSHQLHEILQDLQLFFGMYLSVSVALSDVYNSHQSGEFGHQRQ